MEMIQATISDHLLPKLGRMFTGNPESRVNELVQNARRAGATKLAITCRASTITPGEYTITLHDNGHGIKNWPLLLCAGKSLWFDPETGYTQPKDLAPIEFPAGVGDFSLMGRRTRISSGRRSIFIPKDGWLNRIAVETIPEEIEGTLVEFEDDSEWSWGLVASCVRYISCMEVLYNGVEIVSEEFLKTPEQGGTEVSCSTGRGRPGYIGEVVHYPEFGCKMQVARHVVSSHISVVCFNFFGQTVPVDRSYRLHSPVTWKWDHQGLPVEESIQQSLNFLEHVLGASNVIRVDLTGEPTGLEMVLPSRSMVVHNQALAELLRLAEKQAAQHLSKYSTESQIQGHRLAYAVYRYAKNMVPDLAEASPVYSTDLDLTYDESPYFITEVGDKRPKPLLECHLAGTLSSDYSKLMLLLARYQSDKAPRCISISSLYSGYSWAQLPKVKSISIKPGEIIGRKADRNYLGDGLWGTTLLCVDDIKIHIVGEREPGDGGEHTLFAGSVNFAISEEHGGTIYATPEFLFNNDGMKDILWALICFPDLDDAAGDEYRSNFEEFLEEYLYSLWDGAGERLRIKCHEFMQYDIRLLAESVVGRYKTQLDSLEIFQDGRVIFKGPDIEGGQLLLEPVSKKDFLKAVRSR